MRIDIISAVPPLLESPLNESLIKRARDNQIVEIVIHNLRDYGLGKYHQIDDEPFGGGAGMVLRVEPVFALIRKLQAERNYDEIIFLTPDGKRFEQGDANELSLKNNLLFLCGRYKGIDERIRLAFITKEISIGDYVLTGGEIPAIVMIDSIVRLIPGVLEAEATQIESHSVEGQLEYPQYTRPEEYKSWKVPKVLLSGNHKEIEDWRARTSSKV